MSRDSSWGRQVWLYPAPCAMGLKVWNLIKFNQNSIKWCAWILHLLPHYLGLTEWGVTIGPLSLASHMYLQMVTWRGRKSSDCLRVRSASLCFCIFVLLFTKPSHPSLSLRPIPPTYLTPELPAMVPVLSRSWYPSTEKPCKSPPSHVHEVWEWYVSLLVHPLFQTTLSMVLLSLDS